MLLITSIVGVVYSLIQVMCTSGLDELCSFIAANPECRLDLFFLGVSGTLTLYFIIYVVKHQGPVAFAVAAVMKNLASIIISSVAYNHPISDVMTICAIGATIGALVIIYLASQRVRKAAARARIGHLRGVLWGTWHFRRALGGFKKDNEDKSQSLETFKETGPSQEAHVG